MVVKREWRRLFHADAARSNPAIRQRRRRDFRGALVFLPRAHFRRELQLFAHAPFFERWHNDNRLARARKHQRKQPLAHSPANSCEVIEGSPRRNEHRAILRRPLGHPFLRMLDPSAIFVYGDGMNARTQRLQAGKRFRKRIGPTISGRFAHRRERGNGSNQAAFQESSPRYTSAAL